MFLSSQMQEIKEKCLTTKHAEQRVEVDFPLIHNIPTHLLVIMAFILHQSLNKNPNISSTHRRNPQTQNPLVGKTNTDATERDSKLLLVLCMMKDKSRSNRQ